MPRAYDDPAVDLHALQGLARMRAYGFEDINSVVLIGLLLRGAREFALPALCQETGQLCGSADATEEQR